MATDEQIERELASEVGITWPMGTRYPSGGLVHRMWQSLVRYASRCRELEQAERWIPVSERLPKLMQSVLVPGGAAQYRSDGWWTHMDCPMRKIQWNVTHWRPIPEPPERQLKEPEGEAMSTNEWTSYHEAGTKQPTSDAKQAVAANVGCEYAVNIKIHTTDAYMSLDSTQLVRDIVGEAIDSLKLQEEIDYTLEVKRVY